MLPVLFTLNGIHTGEISMAQPYSRFNPSAKYNPLRQDGAEIFHDLLGAVP
jgi:hypothetical protein